jgi:KUP system potassium uptake protein
VKKKLEMLSNESGAVAKHRVIGLTIGALGVVYGDIGTSPLYTLRECFHGAHGMAVTAPNVLGVLSLILWSLISLVSVKYLAFVLRADNKGEGGILSLMALAFRDRESESFRRGAKVMVALGLFGTALLYGDGMITPAISVLGAMEGLTVATPLFQPFIVPITVAIFVVLFSVQKFGTGAVGKVFGRVTFLWFLALALLGIKGILAGPAVLKAINPYHAWQFFAHNGWNGFIVLGAVFLCVTGAEALYADMGHFGRRPIRLAWFYVVLPALLLNYFGQGALLLENPSAAQNPFYRLAPIWVLYPLVVLATMAAIIASQALISGAFSLTMQAVQLGYLPRLKIEHTSHMERGQIYIAQVNWLLMFACIGLVIGFKTSSNLAAAYGIAVTMTMIITTLLFDFAARKIFGWSRARAFFVCLPFLLIEIAFFGANALKIAHGGWFPLVIGGLFFLLLTTWKTGRRVLARRLQASTLPLSAFLDEVAANPPHRVKGTAVYLSSRTGVLPLSLLHNLKHNKVLHERVVILTINAHDRAYVENDDRIEVNSLASGFHRVVGHFGYMEEADVPNLLRGCASKGLELNVDELSYFVSKETIIPSPEPGMMIMRERLFAMMSRNALSAAHFFKLPPNRVVELGMQVEI